MIKYIISAFLWISGWAAMFGQSAGFTGTVADSANRTPVAGAIIQLLDGKGNVLNYTLSKEDGKFSLSYSPEGKSLTFKSMGYKSLSIPISGGKPDLEILLTSEPVQLRDVIVKAPDILLKNDTLVYNVEKFADAQDRTIADVLKKMPGVEVSESGQIKYNGHAINKFYIEGNDLLEGRYGLATNNISHSDVQNVEIMENHQPVRALQGVENSEQAGLNLRLKENAKLRWSGIANAGTGLSPMLYDASLFAMRIAGKMQSLETVRINNTGWNPASQSALQTYDNLFRTAPALNPSPDYISVGSPSTPMEDRRTRFNRSFLLNSTHSMKLKNDYDLKTNIVYEKDDLDFSCGSHTDYFDSAIRQISETESLQSRAQTLSARFTLHSNKPLLYLKDNFSVNTGWNSATSDISGTYSTVQMAKKPEFNIINELQAVKRIKNRILTVASSNSANSRRHSLSANSDEKQYLQDIEAFTFQSATEASYGWIFGQWQVRGRAGGKYFFNALESRLNGIVMDGFLSENDARLNVTNLYVRPEAVYENRRLLLNPYVLLNYYGYFYNEKNPETADTKHLATVSPTLFARYKFSARLEMSMDARFAAIPPKTALFQQGIIMNSYRNLTAGLPSYNIDIQQSASLTFRYRNPVSSFFANLALRYEKSNRSPIENQTFIDNRILMTYSHLENKSDVFNLNGGVSKGIFSGKIRAGVDMSFFRTKSATLRNSSPVPYRSSVLSVTPRIKGTLIHWMSAEYMLHIAKNEMSFTDSRLASSSNNLKQKLNISIFPSKKIQANVGMEHYRTKFDDKTADNLLLMDAGARWKISEKVDIFLSATNLMNDSHFRYSRYGTLSETVYSYRIRPRNVMLSLQARI